MANLAIQSTKKGMNNKSLSVLAFTAALGFSGAAGAGLIDRGGGLIYDDVLKITWLQDANYGAGSSYDDGFNTTDGAMTWQNAFNWADNLTYYDSVRNVTYDDWRLPITIDTGTPGCNSSSGGTDCGYNVQTADTSTTPVTVYSELAYMYHVNLGLKSSFNTSGQYQSDWGIFGNGTRNGTDNTSTTPFGQNDVGLIDNLQASVYWSGTVSTLNSLNAWYFATHGGHQNGGHKGDPRHAWAVRPGDVAAAASPSIPEPGSLTLVGLGLVGLGWARRRRG